MRTYMILGFLVLLVTACGDSSGATDDGSPTSLVTTTSGAATVPPDTVAAETTSPATTASPAPAETTTTTAPPTTTVPVGSLDDLEIRAVEYASGFEQPVLLTAAPSGSEVYVVDQPGVIWVLGDAGPQVFLDISADVAFGGERGLLGLTFHPDYAANGHFFVHYSGQNGDTVVEQVRADGGVADPSTRSEVLRVEQPAGNHNGGMIAFGPDGNLWIGLGDGGGADDQFGQGQRPDTLLGAMLRISVGPDIEGYAIPPDNLQGEVWAYGLRNPWRWAFDGNDLWIGDVGQGRIEEVNVVDWTTGNPNFGWSIMEGTECFQSSECDSSGLILPVYEYPHSEGCSVTGGVVYRGGAMPELAGQFLFADYCSGWVRSVDKTGEAREWLPAGSINAITSFGVGADGETYVLSAEGTVFLLERAG
jgi:glucose/arabinose dehydrogenase